MSAIQCYSVEVSYPMFYWMNRKMTKTLATKRFAVGSVEDRLEALFKKVHERVLYGRERVLVCWWNAHPDTHALQKRVIRKSLRKQMTGMVVMTVWNDDEELVFRKQAVLGNNMTALIQQIDAIEGNTTVFEMICRDRDLVDFADFNNPESEKGQKEINYKEKMLPFHWFP